MLPRAFRVATIRTTSYTSPSSSLFLVLRSCVVALLVTVAVPSIQGSKLVKPSSPGLWLLRVLFCARFGRKLYILPRLVVDRWWACDSPESFFVRSLFVLQSSLLGLVPCGQSAPSTNSRVY